MQKNTLVIGHKNPDTDAICSAIGYADFLRRVRGLEEAEAACCGVMNARTAWVLDQAGVAAPKRVLDVRAKAGDIARSEICLTHPAESFLTVYQWMADRGFRSIPVVGDDGVPVGIVTLQSLLQLVLPDPGKGDAVREVKTSVESISRALPADIKVPGEDMEIEEDLIMTIAGSSIEVFCERTSRFEPKQMVVIVGDRPRIHEVAIERGVRALVLTGGFSLESEALMTLAKTRGVCVLTSMRDTASTLQLIRCSRSVESAIDTNFRCFKSTDPVDSIRESVANVSQALFPVVDPDDSRIIGVLSKSDLVDPPSQKLVLVDHNEFSQAVDGADEADIIEVIDHHRLGGNLVTKEPVRFINEIVGSTCTIVAKSFRDAGVEPTKEIALCLCAGMIADTLILSSPTATKTDAEMLSWLAPIAGIDIEKFGNAFFEVGSVLRELSFKDALSSDRKEFDESGWKISISQIEELGLDEFEKCTEDLAAELNSLVEERQLDFACLMVTDISCNNSILLTAGSDEVDDEIFYPQIDSRTYSMKNVVSRKKQLLPAIGRILAKLPKK
jgi:manganese-dependent inorganic pyrophosphatase